MVSETKASNDKQRIKTKFHRVRLNQQKNRQVGFQSHETQVSNKIQTGFNVTVDFMHFNDSGEA